MGDILDSAVLFAVATAGTWLFLAAKDCYANGEGLAACLGKAILSPATCGSKQAAQNVVACVQQYPSQTGPGYWWCTWKAMWAATGGPIP